MNNKGFIKEVLVMTLADAITAIAVYFFLVPSHTSISSISGLGDRIDPLYSASALRDHDGLQCHFTDHRVYPLWKRVRSKDRVYKRHAAGISGNF